MSKKKLIVRANGHMFTHHSNVCNHVWYIWFQGWVQSMALPDWGAIDWIKMTNEEWKLSLIRPKTAGDFMHLQFLLFGNVRFLHA